MNTENTENIKGWVCYDGKCPFCLGWLSRTYSLLVRHGLHPVPLQAGWVKARLRMSENDPLTEMKLLMANGRVFGGADALVQIAGFIWWAWPIFAIAHVPGVRPWLRKLYRKVAANRYCLSGTCPVSKDKAKKHRGTLDTFFEL